MASKIGRPQAPIDISAYCPTSLGHCFWQCMLNPHPRLQKNLLVCSLRGLNNLYWSNQNEIYNLFPCSTDKALVYQNYTILPLAIAIIHVGIIRISLLMDIHQLMFSHTLWYKTLKVYMCLNWKPHITIRLSPLMDSGVRTDPAAAMP